MKLKPYPEYKDSGVPWLGTMPRHWETRRLRNVTEMRVSNVDKHSKDDELPVRLCNYVDVYKHDRIRHQIPFMHASASSEEIARFRLERGDVLITKDSEAWNDIGVPALVEETADNLICGYHLALLRPLHDRLHGEYLFRALQSTGVAYQFHVEANGVTRYELSHAAIKSIWLPLPPLSEQSAIVRYLDHIDLRIQRYIRAKRRLIALLNEQKQAIIHRAVTRGLDPNVRFKPSGIDWLGEVPEHWEVRRNATLFRERIERGDPQWPILVVSLRTGVTIGNDEDEDGRPRRLIEDRANYKKALRGDIAYNMMRMWQGAVGVVPVDGLVSPAYVVAVPRPGVHSSYYSHWFCTDLCKAQVNRVSTGIVSDRNRLYWDNFKMLYAPVPSFEEQARIVAFIAEATDQIVKAITKTEHEIDLVREYRTRLIADVVTGKLDVCEAAATLPDEANEREAFDGAEVITDGNDMVEDADLEVVVEEAEA